MTNISTDSGYNVNTNSTSIVVTKTGVQGATDVSTGLTNDFLTDSFFLPLLIMLVGIWLWKSGAIAELRWKWLRKKAGK